MRLGMFMQPVHDPKRDQTQVIDEDREAIILADKLGFEEVWVGEHAAATVEPITAPLVFLATLLGETKNIKLGTGVFCLPKESFRGRSPLIIRRGGLGGSKPPSLVTLKDSLK